MRIRTCVLIIASLVVACPALAQFDHVNLTYDFGAIASEVSVNDAGDVIFLTDDGLYLHRSGVISQWLPDGNISRAVLNNLGQLAYERQGQIFLVRVNGMELILSANLEEPARRPSLNNLGQVAFESDGEIYLFAGAFVLEQQPLLVEITSNFAPHASRPSLNDLRQIACEATAPGVRHVDLCRGVDIQNLANAPGESRPNYA